MRKLAVRRRIEDYRKFVLKHGRIRRADIMRMGEVGVCQASHDLGMLMEDHPELGMVYDASQKTYVAKNLPLNKIIS